MLVALQRFDLRIRESHSLKQKRHVLKGLISALRQRFNVSVSEVDHQDLWQRGTIAVATVGGQEYRLRQLASEIERFVDTWPAVEVLQVEVTVHAPDD
ncbi:MAG: DUF503 domain-containing protein [Actinomycetota bacterium]|nr:DUF503 domain-containing protein [Actinomycetota bacterium]MDH5223852.1 DUF503 domain-containing protein [Actinomycetota bacterium]MDH5313850.1 DUF503 domain-containing protein [Actinomycetota bacterium]